MHNVWKGGQVQLPQMKIILSEVNYKHARICNGWYKICFCSFGGNITVHAESPWVNAGFSGASLFSSLPQFPFYSSSMYFPVPWSLSSILKTVLPAGCVWGWQSGSLWTTIISNFCNSRLFRMEHLRQAFLCWCLMFFIGSRQ